MPVRLPEPKRALQPAWLFVGTLLIAVALNACGQRVRTVVITATPGGQGSPLVSPAAFALTLADLGGGYQEVLAVSHSNREVASSYHLTPAQLTRRGRVTSFETEFKPLQSAGMLQIDDVIALWKTAGAARWDARHVRQEVLQAHPRPEDLRPVTTRGLPAGTWAASFRTSKQAANLEDYAVVFSSGRYRVYLQVVATYGSVGDEDVIRLAGTIRRRIDLVSH